MTIFAAVKENVGKQSADGKKFSLQVHYNIMKELLLHFNNTVKDVRTHYFSELISAH